MKFHRYAAVTLLVFAAFACFINLQAREVEPEQEIKSPDGRFTAKYHWDTESTSGGEMIIITDNRTGKVFPSMDTISPVLSLKWAEDSKTLVKIVHIAHGSMAEAVHFNGYVWIEYEVGPGNDIEGIDAYQVVKQVLGKNTLELTYLLSNRLSNARERQVFYLNSFSIDLKTGKRTHEKTTRIDYETLRHLPHIG